MGPENNITDIQIYADGSPIMELPCVELPATQCVGSDKELLFLEAPALNCTLTLHLLKFFRCTNRKRYIKLVRSLGFDRISVQNHLRFVQAQKLSYQKAWELFLFDELLRRLPELAVD